MLVLVHSPSVGPGTWQPVAQHLQSLGVASVVPDLRSISAGGPPYWPRVAATVVESIGPLQPSDPLVLVGHSNAGLFLPAIHQAVTHPVSAAVFVDAGLPATQGETPTAPVAFREQLRALADADGMLPPWTQWWSPEDVAELLPDPAVRAAVVAEQPRLPLDYYEASLPVPAGWASVPSAYLLFSEGYTEEAGQAEQAGWPVERLPGEHLHQVVEPGAVAERILALVDRLTGR